MAKVPCGIIYDGTRYTPEQFMAKLMDGSIEVDLAPAKSNIMSAKERLAAAKEKSKKAYENLGLDPMEQKKMQAQADREVFDAYVSLAKEYIKEGVQSAKDFAAEIGEELTDTIKSAWTDATRGGGGVKRTFLTKRSYEGGIKEETKKGIEKYGLTREIEDQVEASDNARKFVDEVGDDEALNAVRVGRIVGGEASAVWATVLQNIDREIATAQTVEEAKALADIQSDLMQEWDKRLTAAGRESAMMKYIYKNMDIGYNYKEQVRQYKEANNGEISPELEAKFKEWDEELKAAKKRILELERELIEKEVAQAVKDIKTSIDRSKKTTKPRPAVYGKQRVAKGLDDLAVALGVKLSAVGEERVSAVTALTEIGQGLIEEGVATTENVAQKIREYIAERFGGKVNFDEYEDDVMAALSGELSGTGIKIPNSLIRNLVASGIDNINDLTAAVKEAIIEQYPDATDRQIRDAITGYGKTVNKSRTELEAELDAAVRKVKRIGRITSALEDVRNKKRPLRSGLQRDKLDAEERALQKELREAMKDLPLDDVDLERHLKTQLDAAKARLQNQIDDLQREIDTGEQVPRSTRTLQEDEDLRDLKERRDQLKQEHDNKFKDEAYENEKRLNLAKKAAQKRIDDLQRRLREGDFSKVERKPLVEDNELTKWKAKELEIRERYEKEKYKAELANRTTSEKIKSVIWDGWQVPRALLAGFEASFVGVQGLKLTLSNLISNPKVVADAFANAWKGFKSEKNQEEWLRNIRSQEWYPLVKKSKLGITEPSPKALAAEELFYTGWMDSLWRGLGRVVLSPTAYGGKDAYDKAVDVWAKLNPMKPFERAAVGYLNTLRLSKFMDGAKMLESKGYTPEANMDEYKKVADYVNTMTGRASLGFMEKNAGWLTDVFFSPRNWASGIKLGTPYALVYFSKQSPTVRKMAVMDMAKFLGLTTSMVMLAAESLNNDDDDETGVSFNPKSSDFLKIRLGRGRIVDPWGGMQQQIVFSTRIISEALIRMGAPIESSYITKSGERRLGERGAPTISELAARQATNKLNPSAKVLFNYLSAKLNKEGDLVDNYGKPYTLMSELEQNAVNIFAGTLYDLLKDDPKAIDGILSFMAFLGSGVNVEEKNESKKASRYTAAPR